MPVYWNQRSWLAVSCRCLLGGRPVESWTSQVLLLIACPVCLLSGWTAVSLVMRLGNEPADISQVLGWGKGWGCPLDQSECKSNSPRHLRWRQSCGTGPLACGIDNTSCRSIRLEDSPMACLVYGAAPAPPAAQFGFRSLVCWSLVMRFVLPCIDCCEWREPVFSIHRRGAAAGSQASGASLTKEVFMWTCLTSPRGNCWLCTLKKKVFVFIWKAELTQGKGEICCACLTPQVVAISGWDWARPTVRNSFFLASHRGWGTQSLGPLSAAFLDTTLSFGWWLRSPGHVLCSG